jgi:hypothetical protein
MLCNSSFWCNDSSAPAVCQQDLYLIEHRVDKYWSALCVTVDDIATIHFVIDRVLQKRRSQVATLREFFVPALINKQPDVIYGIWQHWWVDACLIVWQHDSEVLCETVVGNQFVKRWKENKFASVILKRLLKKFCILENAVADLDLTVRPRNKAPKSPKSFSEGKNSECQH